MFRARVLSGASVFQKVFRFFNSLGALHKNKCCKRHKYNACELMSNVTEERLPQLQKASLHYATVIDWTAHNSRVLDNFLREPYHVPCKMFEESISFSESVRTENF